MQKLLGWYFFPRRTDDTLDVHTDFDCLNSSLLLSLPNKKVNISIGNFCWNSLVYFFCHLLLLRLRDMKLEKDRICSI